MTDPIKAVSVDNLAVKGHSDGPGFVLRPYDQDMPDGAFFITPETCAGWKIIRYVCPCGCREASTLRLVLPGERPSEPQFGPQWLWDGNRKEPTLSPSIDRSRTCGWHGFLRAGVWVSV